jgi:hypothetical protein
MIPAQELSFDLIPLFDAALWNLSGRTEPFIYISTFWMYHRMYVWDASKVLA